MANYIFWYKKKIKALNLDAALKISKKQEYIFDSIQEKEEVERELAPLIGFNVEYDEE